MSQKSTEVDLLSRVIADTCLDMTKQTLSDEDVDLVARAISSLRYFDEWLENEKLLRQRISYLFSPEMSDKKTELVYLTHLVFLRHILECEAIDGVLHSPVTFVTKPCAFFLFRDYSVQILIDAETLRSENPDVEFEEIGGMIIAKNGDLVKLSKQAILKIVSPLNSKLERPIEETALDALLHQYSIEPELKKEAVSRTKSRGVFKIDEARRELSPDSVVTDKRTKAKAVIDVVGPGEKGTIEVKGPDQESVEIDQFEFDKKFVTASKRYPVMIDGGIKQLDEQTIGKIIKAKLKASRVVQKLLKDFELTTDVVDNVNIIIQPIKKKYSEADGEQIKLSPHLFDKGDFLQEQFYIVIHEFVHVCSRRSSVGKELFMTHIPDDFSYFEDSEEILGMSSSAAYLLEMQTSPEDIKRKLFPKISFHFNNEEKARTFFEKVVQHGRNLIN